MVFDLDGTLVDTLADLADSMNHALASLGQPTHPEAVIRRFIGDGVFIFGSRALREDAQGLVDELVSRMREHYRGNFLNKTAPYPGIKEVVVELNRRGIRLAVLTNKDQGMALRTVEYCFGKGAFEKVVGVVDRAPVKPGPEAITKLIAAMGINKDDCLMVGDSGIDIDTARSAGIRSVGVAWGFRDRQELEVHGADVIMESPEELLHLL